MVTEGSIVGFFEITSLIGKGGMGEVKSAPTCDAFVEQRVEGLEPSTLQLGRKFRKSPPNARKSFIRNILTVHLTICNLSHSIAFSRTLTR